jgi:hypothetical protein
MFDWENKHATEEQLSLKNYNKFVGKETVDKRLAWCCCCYILKYINIIIINILDQQNKGSLVFPFSEWSENNEDIRRLC